MGQRSTDLHNDDDDFDDDDSTAELETDEHDLPTIDCPNCGWLIPEITPRCPYCGWYLTDEDAPPSHKPWWVILGVIFCLYAIYRLLAG